MSNLVETETGLTVPAHAVDEVPDERVEAFKKMAKEWEEELAKLPPDRRLLRKLDVLLQQWLPQQEEWVMFLGPGRAQRRQIEKAIAKAVAKRLMTIPHRRL